MTDAQTCKEEGAALVSLGLRPWNYLWYEKYVTYIKAVFFVECKIATQKWY